MKTTIKTFVFLLLLLAVPYALFSNEVTVKEVAKLPTIDTDTPNPGIAGAFTGTLNNKVIIAGGSNFSQGYPWQQGAKQYTDNIYEVSPTKDGYDCKLVEGIKLPLAIAHGCAATTSSGIFCFGGNDAITDSKTVYCIKTTPNGSYSIESVCELPEGFKPQAVSASGTTIYIHGIEAENNALYKFDSGSAKWTKLSNCPASPRTNGAAFVRQHNGREEAHYLIGGRNVTPQGVEFCTEVWEYTPVTDTWTSKGDIIVKGESTPRVIMAASAMPYGSGHILMVGGDDGREFARRLELEQAIAATQDENLKAELTDKLTEAFTSHKGFSSDILSYHAITNTWIVLSQAAQPLPVVTEAASLNGKIIIVSGEKTPGVRTDTVLEIQVNQTATFGLINYLVIALYLLAMLGVGFYFMYKEKNDTEQFFKGGGNVPWWAAGISIFATALSAITFLSIPAKAYGADWGMFMFNMTILLIVPVIIRFYLPFFRNLNVASAYEYLEQRFSRPVRYIASTFFCLFMFARIAIVLFLPSLALNAVTGINIYLCIMLMGVVTLIYCTMGGIKAVIWGDVIQGAVLVGGAIVSLAYMVGGIEGGLGTFMEVAITDSKFNILDFTFDLSKPVFWVVLLGGFANQLLTYTSDQSVIQRYITVKDTKGTEKGLWLNGLLSVPIAILFFLIGTGLYVFFKTNPELLNIGMQNTDSIFPHFMMCRLPVGIAGLLVAAVFAAAMSTLASNINSTATVLTEDFFRQMRPNVSDKTRMVFARVSGIIVGCLSIGMALMLATFDIASLWDQFNIFLGLFTSGLGGLFMMGIFLKRIGTRGAITGFVGSMVVLLVFNHYSNVSFLLYGFIGLLSCCVIGYMSSFAWGKNR